ncbi:hypothetical protein [Pedobacter ghigonis]|uniref:hypothetical protein n=1 Tax=Pedobacter ghigonis TaxID=2730403 RepID=UPI00158D77F2|nr:hypothetical protein [Pedobacter ghigonis]
MAILHRKEEKIQAVLGRLPKKYTEEQFLEMFIKLYSKDWGKIRSAYTKQAQDKEPGTVINMPKPDVYLKQLLAIYLQNTAAAEVKEEVVAEPVAEVKKAKAPAKKKETATETEKAAPKKAKAPAAKKAAPAKEIEEETKKPKAAAKKPAAKK